jgi:hypothetical protein
VTPDNGGYMVAAYVVTAVLVVVYAIARAVRMGAARRR